jgi:type I restriction enzyme S subunit
MKVKAIPSSWLEKEGCRLDCGPYMSGAIEAKVALEKLSVKKETLHEVTKGGLQGIYHAGREGRTYVNNPAHGVPFLGSTDILASDLSWLSLLARKQVAANPRFTIQEGWILITRSGTIGKMAYTRKDMAGMACSEHVMRIVPDPDKILPGYLYAYLSSRFGVPLVVSGTYGAIIQHIEPYHIANIPVPIAPNSLQRKAHDLILLSGEKRGEAKQQLEKAQAILIATIGYPPPSNRKDWRGYNVSSADLVEFSRFDGFFHNPTAQSLENWIKKHPAGFTTLGEITDDIFDVPPFKHIYVSPDQGVPFFTSGDIFLLDRKTEKFLSRTQTKGLAQYILQQGWILLARSGQLGGIIGRPQYVDSALHRAAASDHVIRIVPKQDASTAGFLYIYLASPDVGYHLLTRTMTGSSVPALWPKYLKQIKVPLVEMSIQRQLDELICQAFEYRVEATAYEDEARQLVESFVEDRDT